MENGKLCDGFELALDDEQASALLQPMRLAAGRYIVCGWKNGAVRERLARRARTGLGWARACEGGRIRRRAVHVDLGGSQLHFDVVAGGVAIRTDLVSLDKTNRAHG